MEKSGKKENKFGLLGKDISYSFSRGYFTDKFKTLGLTDHSYENFDLADISMFPRIIKEEQPKGLNVTIPYKEQVIPFLDELDVEARTIGAVNTIKCTSNGLKGYNTDAYGFKMALVPKLKPHHKKALILGTGGASKAIAYVLDGLGIDFCYISRKPKKGQLSYTEVNKEILSSYAIIINCSPVGTFPNVDDKPALPYQFLTEKHLLFDLIYNPEKTAFLTEGEQRGTTIQNGLLMLQQQAEKAWEIWHGA